MDLIKKMFIGILSACTKGLFDGSLASNSKGYWNCESLNNQSCQAKPTLININSNEPLYYQFSVCVDKCVGNCNTIDDSYAETYISTEAKI